MKKKKFTACAVTNLQQIYKNIFIQIHILKREVVMPLSLFFYLQPREQSEREKAQNNTSFLFFVGR